MFHARCLALLLLAVMLPGPAIVLAQQSDEPTEEALPARDPLQVTFRQHERKLSVQAESVPLRTVLDKVDKLTGITFWVAPGINPAISRNVPDLPIERAIKHVLGPRANYVMIYSDELDAEGNARPVLAEVRVLEGGVIEAGEGSAGMSGGAVTAAPPPVAPAPDASAAPQLSPEELAARQAERRARMAEKAEQRAARSAAKGNRGGRSPRGQAAPDPAAGQPQTDQTGAADQPPSPQLGGQAPSAIPPTESGTSGGGRRGR